MTPKATRIPADHRSGPESPARTSADDEPAPSTTDPAHSPRCPAKKILVFNHELFEDFEDFCPEAQHALVTRFCDTGALISAVDWDPDKVPPEIETFEIPLTGDLVEHLLQRRYDLAFTNRDRLFGAYAKAARSA